MLWGRGELLFEVSLCTGHKIVCFVLKLMAKGLVPAPRVFTCLTLLGTSTVSQPVSVRSSLQAVAGVRATQ